MGDNEDTVVNNRFTGLLSTDEICCNLGIPMSQLEATIEADPNVIVISK